MGDKSQNKKDASRLKADKNLEKQKPFSPENFSGSKKELIENLKIYQVELEAQNEELKQLQVSLEKSKSKFEIIISSKIFSIFCSYLLYKSICGDMDLPIGWCTPFIISPTNTYLGKK